MMRMSQDFSAKPADYLDELHQWIQNSNPKERIMNDYHFLIICAFRYCLGRKSYAVGWICEIIEKEWNKLSKNDKKLIIKEIKEYKEMWKFTEIDKHSWDKILKLENK